MPKDARYRTAQKLILAGLIKSLADLFDTVDKTPLARDIHTAPARLTKLINNPALFTFDDCYKIAALLEVDDDKIIDLVRAESKGKKSRKGR
jgi:plasmid maintenance system antidote protein VapI